MQSPIVSVIIPGYNGADVIRGAIESVLAQTYARFELLIVDDASPESMQAAVEVAAAGDPRVRYLRQPYNQGADAARLAGLKLALGELIAFLDQDDLLHPEKLAAHVAYYDTYPETGVTYNRRFEMNYSATTIRELVRPPTPITLADLVLGYPISPSETVMRRAWALAPEFWDDDFVTQGEEIIVNGGEIVSLGRVFMAGCRFGFVDRALNYRSHAAGRIYRDVPLRCRSELRCQELVLDDERCPEAVRALRDQAYANTYCVWGYVALTQGDIQIGQEYLRQAVALDPARAQGDRSPLLTWMVAQSIVDFRKDHAAELRHVLANLPAELAHFRPALEWGIGRGYLVKGTRAVMWDLPEKAEHFAAAARYHAVVDSGYVEFVAYQLLLYADEFGAEKADQLLDALEPYLAGVGGSQAARQMRGNSAFNAAMAAYRAGAYAEVPRQVARAVTNEPRYLLNRGVAAILVRSLLRNS